MKPVRAISSMTMLTILLGSSVARAEVPPPVLIEPNIDWNRGSTKPAAQKALQDTIWIATWTFENGGECDFTGWEKGDNRILNDGSIYWTLDNAFGGTGGIVGWGAALGYNNDVCCQDVDGYANGWYQGIRITYQFPASLEFDYLLDSELNYDFMRVETDSACSSFGRVDYSVDPIGTASSFRELMFSASALHTNQSYGPVVLPDYGAGTHCVYIAFLSDAAIDPCDGGWPTSLGEALVVDNIEIVEPGIGTRTEDFEDMSLDIGTFVNMNDVAPFGPVSEGGSWARLFEHVSDNDICTENETCALLLTDFTTPTSASSGEMSFAPDGYVVKNWLDDFIISPWVSLASTPGATNTILQFRCFPGNPFNTGSIVQQWSVRGKASLPDGMGGTVDCVSPWGKTNQWTTLDGFEWQTHTEDLTPYFDPTSEFVQVRFRLSDWQYIALNSSSTATDTGPGPYIDRVRKGRTTQTGPTISEDTETGSGAQDSAPTTGGAVFVVLSAHGPIPSTDRFGTAAFSAAKDIGAFTSPNLIVGDSVWVRVQDTRGAGGIARVEFCGAIVSGPHAGLAPPPYAVGANGFFCVPADSARTANGNVVQDVYFVDLDDEYFVGGDVVHYFWAAEDSGSGYTSLPKGLSTDPTSLAEAEEATQGLFEVSFLPTANWDADFLTAVATNNKVDPGSNPAFLDSTTQAHRILYVNRENTRRRSGDINRTSFMYTLDRLGYRGSYDVFDHQGMGNTNNHLGSRMSVQQAQGYNLIVYDAGNQAPSGTLMPDGSDPRFQKIPQSPWFQAWLAQASTSEAIWATLWIVGSNVLQEKPTDALYLVDMQVSLAGSDQGLAANPDVVGVASFAFDVGAGTNVVDFTAGPRSECSLAGGCPGIRDYDALASVGSGVDVYRYRTSSLEPFPTLGDAAVAMHSDPAQNRNTIFQAFAWSDIRPPRTTTPSSLQPEEDLLKSILDAVLPTEAVEPIDPTDSGELPTLDAPSRTLLYESAPNPFNPVTVLRFDLARESHVSLKIYDTSGRLVRNLIDEKLPPGRNITRVWDGSSNAGRALASGVYFYRFKTNEYSTSRKLVLLR